MVRNHRRSSTKLSVPDVVSDKSHSTDNCWDTFCTETTLGGFPNLLPDIHPVRRFFWYCVCISFTIITAYQLILLFSGYADNPIKTTTSQSYPTEMTYPVVAICNTMPFKSSAVHPLSEMHTFLSGYYGSTLAKRHMRHLFSETELQALSEISDTDAFYKTVAHQKEDMIISCKWGNVACDHENFTTVVTEDGVCYAFNFDSSNAKSVKHAGEAYGLQMTLNVATYEEMVGPYVNFGILVKVFPQGFPLLSQNSVYALLGQYTSISLSRKDVTFLEEYNCGEKPLKMFGVYTRAACVREKIYEKVYKACDCYPHGVPETKATKGRNRCSLDKEFFCAARIISADDESNAYSEAECPRECNIQIFTPIVSSAAVAWIRTLKLSPEMNQNLTYNLKRAQESGKRYKPLDKNLTQSVFEELQISIDQMFGLIDKLENKSYQVPPLTASEPHVNLLDKLDLFLQKSYKKLISSLTQSFEEFTNSTINSFSAFENLFLSANNHHQSDNLTTADLTHLSLHKSGNQLTLITLPTIVNELQQLGKVKIELESGIQAAFGLANEDGILSTEAQQTLENITNAFVTLLNTPSKLDTYQTGCLQHPFQPRLNHSNPILLDVYLCLVHRYSSTNTQISLSAEMAELLEELKTNQLEVQQQQEVCNQLLCEAAEIPFESNCTLTIEQLKDLTAVLQLALMPSIEDCNSQLDRAKYDFDQFVVDYKTRLLVDYNWATQLATAIKQNYTKIRDYIGKPINKHRSDLENISSNMTAYISGNITYENFSQTFIKTFKAWLDQSFNFDYNTFKQNLQQLLETIRLINPDMEEILNFTHNGVESEVLALIKPVINNFLWRNGSIDSIEESLEGLKWLLNVSEPFLARLSAGLERFNAAMKAVGDDCKSFMERIIVKPDFYEKNFMVVNVHMQSISIETVAQEYAVNFWNLIADLGGAASFWLGLCMITFVEILDVGVRYGFQCFRCGFQRLSVKLKKPTTIKPTEVETPQ